MKKLSIHFADVGLARPSQIPFPHAVRGGGQRELLYFNGLTITNAGDESFDGPGEIQFQVFDEADRPVFEHHDEPQPLRNFTSLAPGQSIRVMSWIFCYVDITGFPLNANFSVRAVVGAGEWTTTATAFLRKDMANVIWFDWRNLTTEILKLQQRVAVLEAR